MRRKLYFNNRIYRNDALTWYRRELKHVCYNEHGEAVCVPAPDAEEGKGAEPLLRLETRGGKGKISNAGYDEGMCVFTQLPANRDVTFRAVLRVSAGAPAEALTLQEGAGIFLRDTMEPDRGTGYPYSNMAFAGYYHGGWTGFVRSGIAESIEQVQIDCRTVTVSLREAEQTGFVEVTLGRTGGAVQVRIRRAPGEDTSPGTDILDLSLPVPEDFLQKRENGCLYLGFFASSLCRLEARKDGTGVVFRRRKLSAKAPRTAHAAPERRPAPPEAESAQPRFGSDRIVAAPDGRPGGAGTDAEPLDIRTAVSRCGAGQSVALLPGRYRIEGDLILPERSAEEPGTKRLFCEAPECAVLDFGDRTQGLVLRGSGWEIERVAVVHGYGFWIEGKGNRIRNCAAAFNLETGFQIRSLDADPARWPSDNEVTDCVSFCNMDESEHNADGFACKVAAGSGNVFRRCRAFLNSDDGFDLFSKNRATGAVVLEDCRSWMNGYRLSDGRLQPTKGNGNGFKLGGSGQRVPHRAIGCEAIGNRSNGFTSNSNPWMHLERCSSGNNGSKNYQYYYTSPFAAVEKEFVACDACDAPGFDRLEWLGKRLETEELWQELQEENGSTKKARTFSTR